MLENYVETFLGSSRTIAKLPLQCSLLGYISLLYFLRAIIFGTKVLSMYETADSDVFQSRKT